MKKTALTTTILLLAGGAFAGGSHDASGVGTGKSSPTVHQVSEGHMLMALSTEYSKYEMADADNPMNGMSGNCAGVIEVRVPSVTGGGHCALTNGTGDTSYTTWTATGMGADGAINGTWILVGGTGVFAGGTGGGTFSSLTDQATGDSQNTIAGAVSLK